MTSAEKEAIKRFNSLSECCICLMTYTDPRMLPCFHTACLKCFEDIQSKNMKKPGDTLPCPLCRKEFRIPPEGMTALQKNFFVESLVEMTKTVGLKNTTVTCLTCSEEDPDDVAEAKMRCLNCCENYCMRCSKIHIKQKFAKDHKIVEINSKLNEEEIRNIFPIRMCKKHSDKVLDYYCSDCKTVVCVSCFVEDHQTHKCNDVKTIDKDFRQRIEECSTITFDYKRQMLIRKEEMEKHKMELLAKTLETEKAIRSKSCQLKALIEQHTQEILNELSLLKEKHRKKMEIEIEEIERKLTVLDSFVAYCTELKSKRSPSEVCASVDNLIARAKELTKENDEYLSVPCFSIKIEFISDEQNAILRNVGNVVGKLSESSNQFERCTVIIARVEGASISNDVIRINLNRPEDVSYLQKFPTEMQMESAAAVYRNSIFVTGVGNNYDEIWKFDATASEWKKCASVAEGRRCHSVAFVNHILYICGGKLTLHSRALKNVEAYDTDSEACATVGQLIYAVGKSGNCLPFKSSLYIFGGLTPNSQTISNVQVYDTKLNTCSLLKKPMPKPYFLLRAALWENTVILLGYDGSLTYNFDTEIWQERNQFKTGATDFGMSINDGKIFIIGGENTFHRDDVRWIPVMNILNNQQTEWRYHAKLPRPSLVYAFGDMDCFVKIKQSATS